MKVDTRAELHRLVDQLDDINAEILLEYLRDLLSGEEVVTEEELEEIRRGEEQIARGEYVTLEELEQELRLARKPEG